MGVAFDNVALKKGPIYPAVALLHCAGCTINGCLPIPASFKWLMSLFSYFIYFLLIYYWGINDDGINLRFFSLIILINLNMSDNLLLIDYAYALFSLITANLTNLHYQITHFLMDLFKLIA